MKRESPKTEFVGDFTIRPVLNVRQRLALVTGAKLVLAVRATSLRDPVQMAINAVAHTTRNGDGA
jgi:hypothetical protein